MSTRKYFESSYKAPGKASWNKSTPQPPLGLIDFIERKLFKPCKTLDVGCGEGQSSVYLAKRGFNVTGIDYVENAIRYARRRAKKDDVKVKFSVKDVDKIETLKQHFDFIIEFGLLHHYPRNKWRSHFEKIYNLMNSGGICILTCANIKSNKDASFSNHSGRKIYFSSLSEIIDLLEKRFEILQATVAYNEISKKFSNFLLVKKS